ncbi:unnamed protein product [Paramecium sonneborni]|uniref:Uncharacterized protein n=1 Tax=Paramecium sonneborni TaxID=65129 RepID=A0A8S1PPE0_9CILI|nr:unnamed protein product [Paramecium sonneborni]
MNQYLATHDSSLNTSLSKQKYTFPKAQRQPIQNKSATNELSYKLPQSLGTRQAGIGYGLKHDFSKDAKPVPGPNLYDIQSFVENNLDKKKGPTFAYSREQMKAHGMWGSLNQISPGPARYESTNSLIDSKFTIGLKSGSLKQFTTPGPGAYEAIQITNQRGNQFISKFRSSGAAIIGKDQDRFKTLQTQINFPEPASYDISNTGITGTGFCPKNGFKSSVQNSFPKAIRKGPFDLGAKSPGPGSYKAYSEFE